MDPVLILLLNKPSICVTVEATEAYEGYLKRVSYFPFTCMERRAHLFRSRRRDSVGRSRTIQRRVHLFRSRRRDSGGRSRTIQRRAHLFRSRRRDPGAIERRLEGERLEKVRGKVRESLGGVREC